MLIRRSLVSEFMPGSRVTEPSFRRTRRSDPSSPPDNGVGTVRCDGQGGEAYIGVYEPLQQRAGRGRLKEGGPGLGRRVQGVAGDRLEGCEIEAVR
ncbi:hypothetical protein GCM10010353_72670 [Streptomyces chryseus]|nr:hypothetical protein GCM10010353_72670 [Streptomyces chryseus]